MFINKILHVAYDYFSVSDSLIKFETLTMDLSVEISIPGNK